MIKIIFALLIFSFTSAWSAENHSIENSNLDWASLSQIMQTYRTDNSLKHLRENVRLFLLSSSIQSLRLNEADSSCENKIEVQSIVSSELVDMLFEEILLNFPFYKPQKSGCGGFLCTDPLYTVWPNVENFDEKRKWEELTKWINNDQVIAETSPSSPYYLKSRGAFKAYTLIKSLEKCRLPKSNWGRNADAYAKIWAAVEFTINPQSQPYKGYTIVTGRKSDFEIIQLLEFTDQFKRSIHH